MSKEPSWNMTREFDQLLEANRSYLLILARMRMGKQLQGKYDPADLVQQTLLEAHRDRSKFRGRSEAELRGWLHLILTHHIGMALRALGTSKRAVDRELLVQTGRDATSVRLEAMLAAPHTSPTQKAQQHEQIERLAAALIHLPEAQREAVVLKHYQDWTVAAIARHMDRTPEAVAGLLKRGLQQLRALLEMEAPSDQV